MRDVTIKIPLPEGTRFLDAGAESAAEVSFDGEEITFFASILNYPLRNAFFVVEVTEPDQTIFTTNAWISWKGDQPGDFLTNQISFDVTRQPLNWDRPPWSSLELEAKAIVTNETITYTLYPKHVGWRRMWDLKINVPIPNGATLIEANAPPPFTTDFDGQEVSFFTSEIESQANIEPLTFKVSTEGTKSPFLVTHAWATWKNVGWGVGSRVASQEDTRTGDIIIQSQTSEQVVADNIGDVPFANYDLTSIGLQEDAANLRISFYTAGQIDPVGVPLEFFLYIDSDCDTNTGQSRNSRGIEYIVRYRHDKGQATVQSWDEEKEGYGQAGEVDSLVGGKTVVIWLPYNLIENDQQFCWVGQAINRTQEFYPNPPSDLVLNKNIPTLNQFEGIMPIPEISVQETVPPNTQLSPSATETPVPIVATPTIEQKYFIQAGDEWRYLKGHDEPSYPVTAWRQVDYDDSSWLIGQTGIGYGDKDDATILADMLGNYTSVFMRHTFEISDTTTAKTLILEIDYDDAFVAYLNGTEIARRNLGNAGDLVPHNALATSSHKSGNIETIDISAFTNLLQLGKNVLAVQGHNYKSLSSDFLVNPALRGEYMQPPVTVETPTVTSDDVLDTTAVVTAPNESTTNNSTPLYGMVTEPIAPPPSAPSNTDISGKLAVPIDNGQALYDVHIFSMPEGQEIAKIPNARQPNFRFDGQRILINHEGGGTENVFEYNLTDGSEKQVSDAPQDWYPFYDAWGNRVVYGNSELTVGNSEPVLDNEGHVVRSTETHKIIYHSPRKPFIFVQCGLLPPHQETEPRCQNIPWLGVLVPAGQMGEIQGTHPVWTSEDKIVYSGCNSWSGFAACGIYSVPSASTKGFSDGFIPAQLTKDTSDIPTDTKGNLIAFMSHRDGNWEIYIINLDGTGLKNLSNNPNFEDGLPTISPDGNWVAFVSNQNGRWAIWAVPVIGGPAKKLFDLPGGDNLWGEGTRDWTNERISWGP